MIINANFDFEIRDFLLRAGARRFPGVRDLLHDAFEFAIAVRIDFDVGFVAQLHVNHVVFVHIDHGLHVSEVSHPHHFGPGELIGGNEAFAQFAVQNRDRSVHWRIDRCLGKLIARLA